MQYFCVACAYGVYQDMKGHVKHRLEDDRNRGWGGLCSWSLMAFTSSRSVSYDKSTMAYTKWYVCKDVPNRLRCTTCYVGISALHVHVT